MCLLEGKRHRECRCTEKKSCEDTVGSQPPAIQGREASGEDNPARTLIFDFQTSDLGENKFCLSHPVCGILLWWSFQTNRVSFEYLPRSTYSTEVFLTHSWCFLYPYYLFCNLLCFICFSFFYRQLYHKIYIK